MNRRNAIVIMVDRLGAGYLGPYGNTWVETPAWNRFASQSLLWEFMLSTTPTLASTYASLTTGRHPLSPDSPPAPSLWEQFQRAGIHSAMLSDDPRVLNLDSQQALSERIEQLSESGSSAAESLEGTQLCQLFIAALDWLARPRESFCLVVHARGMAAAWDAPRDYRERFADEEDPPVPEFIDPPHRSLGQDVDPDEIWGITQAYAGQIVLLDDCLEMLLNWLDADPRANETLLLATSPRGFPLGEHGHLGERGDGLNEEVLHVPLLIRHPAGHYAMQRSQSLAQTADLFATLADWFELPLATGVFGRSLLSPHNHSRDRVVSVLDQARSLRTHAWFLRLTPEQPPQLYAKPDDRWEVNEVAARCGDVTEELAAQLADFERRARDEQLAGISPLPDHLASRMD